MDLPRTAIAALKHHCKKQIEEKLQASGAYEDDGLVFATAKGTLLDAQNFVNRRFKPLLKRAGVTTLSLGTRGLCSPPLAW